MSIDNEPFANNIDTVLDTFESGILSIVPAEEIPGYQGHIEALVYQALPIVYADDSHWQNTQGESSSKTTELPPDIVLTEWSSDQSEIGAITAHDRILSHNETHKDFGIGQSIEPPQSHKIGVEDALSFLSGGGIPMAVDIYGLRNIPDIEGFRTCVLIQLIHTDERAREWVASPTGQERIRVYLTQAAIHDKGEVEIMRLRKEFGIHDDTPATRYLPVEKTDELKSLFDGITEDLTLRTRPSPDSPSLRS